jgi:hypothetical protein
VAFSTTEISNADRSEWLDAFSMRHDGWLVSLDVFSSALGAQPLFRNEPLIGVTSDPGGSGRLVITAGHGVDHVMHVINAPSHLWLERTADGADAALAIEAADGTKTILRFRTAALPETVDGIPK